MTPSDLRERVARAICKAEGDDPDSLDPWVEPEHQCPAWEHYEDHADAAIALVLEEAAKVAKAYEHPNMALYNHQTGIAADIRALKEKNDA